MTWKEDARRAIKAAATLRAKLGYSAAASVCPFDIAERLGVNVHFLAAPSLEGMYSASQHDIVISSLRPSGRRRYTCAHELGHHLHGHGTRFDGDEEFNSSVANEEYVANHFARGLLMPKLAVANAFVRRGWPVAQMTDNQVFVVSQDLGVGFTSLLDHMAISLGMISAETSQNLKKCSLPKIRKRFIANPEHDVFQVDEHWGARPVDLEVGDYVLLPDNTAFSGACLARKGGGLVACTPGVGQVSISNRQIPVRVGRRGFEGRAMYRFLEDADEE